MAWQDSQEQTLRMWESPASEDSYTCWPPSLSTPVVRQYISRSSPRRSGGRWNGSGSVLCWLFVLFFYQFCNSICIWKKMEILSHDDDWILRIHICTKRMKFLRYMQKAFKDSITLPWVTIDRSRNITKYLWANAIVIFVFKRWRMRNESVKFI